MTGISKSQVNLSLQRSIESGLVILDRKSQVPGANIGVLKDFIVYGLPYVFPVKLGAVTRGISTSLAAPVLQLNYDPDPRVINGVFNPWQLVYESLESIACRQEVRPHGEVIGLLKK